MMNWYVWIKREERGTKKDEQEKNLGEKKPTGKEPLCDFIWLLVSLGNLGIFSIHQIIKSIQQSIFWPPVIISSYSMYVLLRQSEHVDSIMIRS